MRLNFKNKEIFDFFESISRSKTWLIMKITIFLSFAIVTMASANSYSQRINLELKKTKMEIVFSQIEKLSGYSFLYERNTVKGIAPVDVSLKNSSVVDALNVILKNQPLEYVIRNNFIVISQKENLTAPQASLSYINQLRKVTGVVKDTSGRAIGGVSVLNKKTGKVIATDNQGIFTLDADVGDVLVFSSIGYSRREITIGTETRINVTLREENDQLEQVVVTALGIKRSARSLTYNVQEIKGTEFTQNKDANFVNSIVGKVAGVTINASAGGIGGATRVVMRGAKSINGNNNALYVVDGIPVLNNVEGNKPEGLFGGTTGSEGISGVNPDDIESMSVLTGAAASALYGSQGQNGVIIITTKSGVAGKTQLSVSNNSTFFSPFVMPRFQNTYGQSDPGSFYSWGPELAEPSSYSPKDFFQTGANITNSLTFSTGTDKNQTYISAAMLNGKGIIPNNEITRYNFSVRNTSKFLNDKLTLDLNLMYSKQNEQNMFAQGLYHSPIVPIYLFPPGANIKTYQTYERYDANRFFPTQFWPFSDDQFRMQNPYWITNREFYTTDINKLLTGLSLRYDVLDWLNLTSRVRLERNVRDPNMKLYASTNQLFAGPGGRFSYATFTDESKYIDLIANMNKTVNDFNFQGNIGYTNTNNSNNGGMSIDSYIPLGAVPNLFTASNAGGTMGTTLPDRTSFQAVFVNAETSYLNTYFLNASYRTDWYSQLYGTDKLYLTYPSVGAAIVVSDMFKIPTDILSFMKLRANYSIVGTPPRIYLAGPQTYPIVDGVLDYSSGVARSEVKPERTKGWEVGANMRFLNDRINFDVTLYKTNTYNQIFNVPTSASTLYNSRYINAGQVNNKGIEAALGYTGKIGQVNWQSNATFTLNRNKVIKLVNAMDTLEMAGAGSYSMKVTTNGTLSDIYTSTLRLDEHGDVLLRNTVAADEKNVIYAGHASPDFTVGYRNSFNYKNLDLSFVLFGRFGGVGVSATQAMMDAFGVSETTAEARERGHIIINGAKESGIQDYYTVMGNGLNGVLSQYVYSATNIRLKELSIGYTVPSKVFKNKIQGLRFSVTGQNLFMFYNKAPFDPESTASTDTYYQGIDYFMQPSLRGVGFSVRAQF